MAGQYCGYGKEDWKVCYARQSDSVGTLKCMDRSQAAIARGDRADIGHPLNSQQR